jgi:hypothetical protein
LAGFVGFLACTLSCAMKSPQQIKMAVSIHLREGVKGSAAKRRSVQISGFIPIV